MKNKKVINNIKGCGGILKKYAEDFIVREVPAYSPCGEGTHTYFGLWKKNIDTQGALRLIARELGLKAGNFGTAGLKDATAITEQTASIEHLTGKQLKKLENFDNGQVRVTWVSKHTNKLKPGHLIANQFEIRVRDTDDNASEAELENVREKLKILTSRGVPNFYGEQRFGKRGDNHLLGKALLLEDYKLFSDTLLGQSQNDDSEKILQARDFYKAENYEQALRLLTGSYRTENKLLHSIIKNKGNFKRAISSLDKFLKHFYINALQSYIFNSVLNNRIESYDTVLVGDLAVKTSGSPCFAIEAENIEREKARASIFEISATAIMPGSKVNFADGDMGKAEKESLEYIGLSLKNFAESRNKPKGTRRPLRYPIVSASASSGTDENGNYIQLNFTAPPGAYATTLFFELS